MEDKNKFTTIHKSSMKKSSSIKKSEDQIYNRNKNANENIVLSRNLFLTGLSYIYLFALLSGYSQIQGLWGDHGILPVISFFKKINLPILEKNKTFDMNSFNTFFNFPSISFHFSESINSLLLGILKNLNFVSNGEYFSFIIENLSKFSAIQNSIHIVTLIGILVSLSNCLQFKLFYNKFGFLLLYICYLNLFLIGQVFMSFQWDIYLLEVGFLGIFISSWKYSKYVSASEELFFNLLKFLNFKFMFSSGIVKITANCPAWLSFTALHHHFQSQPLPNRLSIYAHFLDDSLKKILTAGTFLIELYLPFLLLLPSSFRLFQIFSGICMFIFEVGIILTGNYNFFNLLTIVVNISAFDDLFLRAVIPNFLLEKIDPLYEIMQEQEEKIAYKEKNSRIKLARIILEKINNHILNLNANSSINNINIDKNLLQIIQNAESDSEKIEIINNNLDEIKKDMGFQNNENSLFMKINENRFVSISIMNDLFLIIIFLVISIIILFYFIYPIEEILNGSYKLNVTDDLHYLHDPYFLNLYLIVVFFCLLITFLLSSIRLDKEHFDKNHKIISLILFSIKGLINLIIAGFLTIYFYKNTLVFKQSIELQPMNIDNSFVENIVQNIHEIEDKMFSKVSRFSLFGYGLFRVMTGINGRPELEILYTHEIYPNENDWKPINFIYKPQEHKRNLSLFINIPHQPRIDWQIWFSALRPTYSSEEWLINLCGRILEKNDVVLDLLGYENDDKINIQFLNKIFNSYYGITSPSMKNPPTYLKIVSYIYKFEDDFTSKYFWKKRYVKEYLPQINMMSLKKFFELQGYPLLNKKSEFSYLQRLPINDVIIVLFILVILIRKVNL